MSDATGTPFRSAAAFRAWLERHHRDREELVVRLYKTHAKDRGMTYAEALDEVLCFGWIDGVRRSIDADSFSIRFTPRKPRSIWSRVNVRHVERLIQTKKMRPPGLAAYRARTDERTGVYSFERAAVRLAPAFEKRFRANAAAWKHFNAQAPWYRRTSTYWVMSAKREETRVRRLELLIDCSKKGVLLPALRREPAKKARA